MSSANDSDVMLSVNWDGSVHVVSREAVVRIIKGESVPANLGDFLLRAILADWLTEVESKDNGESTSV